MRPSRGDHDNSNIIPSSSSSKSLSPSSSPSSSHSSILRNPRRKTMEEAWNTVMNRTCIHHNSNTSSSSVEELSPLPKTKTTSPTFNNLQNKDTQIQKRQSKLPILIPRYSTTQVHPPPPPPPQVPQPQSLSQTINLNIVCDDDNTDEHPLGSNPTFNQNNLSFIDYSTTYSFASTLNTSHPLHQSFGSTPFDDINCSIDRSRHKRMINNRESAARSRARKQAYSNELELEVARLMEENAMLRKQQQKLCLAAAAANQHPKKTTLQRTSTAPF